MKSMFEYIMKKASYSSERTYNIDQEKVKIDPNLLKYWERYLSNEIMEKIVLCSKYKLGLTENSYTYSPREDYKEMQYLYDFLLQNMGQNKDYSEEIPFFSFYSACLETGKMYLESKWEMENIQLSSAIIKSFQETLLKQLTKICMRTLIQEMHILKKEKKLLGNSSQERFYDFERRYLISQKYIEEIFTTYPVMCRCILETIMICTKNYVEVYRRLQNDKNDIEKILCSNQKFSEIAWMSSSCSDCHKNGQSVYIIELDNGIKIVYKPHSLYAEQCYDKLFSAISIDCGFCGYERKIIFRNEYGWEEFCENKECESKEAVEDYYQRFGIIMAIAYILHTGDLHYENIIAKSEFPVLIDCETLLCNWNHVLKKNTVLDKIRILLSDSVLFSGLLPRHVYGDQNKFDVDVSALSGVEGQIFPIKVPKIVNVGTDEMKVAYVNPCTGKTANIPKILGENVKVEEYYSFITAGFYKAYQQIIKNKEKIYSLLQDYSTMQIRYLIRNTQQYDMLEGLSYHPDFLQDGVDREMILLVLGKNVDVIDDYELNIINMEQKEMLRGDIPYFWYSMDGKTLYNRMNLFVENFFTLTNIEVLEKKLSSLNEEDAKKQILYIQLLLSNLSEYKGRKQSIATYADNYDNRLVFSREKLLLAVDTITEDLLKKAIFNDDYTEVNWLGITMEGNEKGIWTFEPLGNYLYDGLAGVTVYLAAIVKIMPEKENYNMLFKILKNYFMSYTNSMTNITKRIKMNGNGIFHGEASIMYMYQILYEILHDKEYLEYAEKHYEIVERTIYENQNHDILMGTSGAIMVMLNMYILTSKEKYLQTAITLGDILDKNKIVTRDGVGWLFAHETKPLTGFAHGCAGNALALLRLATISGKSKYLDMCKKTLQYENSMFLPSQGNWRDTRNVYGKEEQDAPVAWCHGAAGILLSRIEMYKIATGELKSILLNDIHLGGETLLKRGYLDNNCLCHGNAGNLMILSEYAKIINNDISKLIDSYWENLIEKVIKKEWNCDLPAAYENISMMIGTSGIGYSLLWRYNEKLPFILNGLL
ncbi:type 2 lanthipeptide synthetase LanM family protein [Dorea longicatena]|uniref:type 2 lanthipeptide synthetase LanM family protein n=1 Tax=Dorea longicatena TaxID=88431 RepID=UPI00040909D9|nr:type 2 lanthipeptide synthetase LanM family protein [Dorea longicatena]